MTRDIRSVPDNGSDTPYTVPTILLPDGTYVMHSLKILEAINKRYPSPPLKYQTPRLDRFMKCVEQTMIAFRGIYVPGVANRLLGEGSLDFFHRTRERDIGMTLAEFEEKEGGEGAYEAMEQHLKQVTALLAEDGGGPFFEGKDVSQIDFVWIGILLFIQRMGEDVFDKVLRRSGDAKKHLDLLEAAKSWYEKDD